MTETMAGVLVFHSETGTEGGWYAFQNAKFMGLPAPNQWVCTHCGRVWDKDRDTEPPKPSFTYWRDMEDQVSPSGTRYVSGFAGYDEPHDDLPEGSPSGADAEWNRRRNAIALVCYTEGHAGFEHMYPNGIWSYEGLHMLKNGDRLRVFAKGKSRVLWEGPVALEGVQGFTHDVRGLWVNQRPTLLDEEQWSSWFLDGHPAELTPKGGE